ncbi:glycosyltransferase family 2 protein [Niveispirillum sp. BGYR6]|uniref:glycosyltransferase family 2 protein n=1 Tax=Niveispirillum sp. BGYR6 TaxID=2971249 RepID=UPI0022B9861A|nr:glycosyltransferase family 2 protein [Niveispirillum sp. BGYR6]MDG5493763.1 glycosyltransferase family 2 protein [Niveispirillum sp. BGYR6]
MSALITILLPFFNEEGWIGATIDSLIAQHDQRFHLILLDNASTDGGRAEAERHLAGWDAGMSRIVPVAIPGKTNALTAGLSLVTTPYVAICDADTHYPPCYVANCLKLFAGRADATAVMAIDLYDPADSAAAKKRMNRILGKARRHRDRCHAGGYAQAFRTDALRAVGGFDTQRWPFVLEDHEVIHRVHRLGISLYDASHYCHPSPRRGDRRCVSWTRFERLLYRFLPRSRMDWFFYEFLWRRLEHRRAFAAALREKNWT